MGGRQEHARVHRLVAAAFLKNPDNLPVVHHRDDNKANNCVENLEYTTSLQNTRYSVLSGRHVYGARHHHATITDETAHKICKYLEENKLSIKEISEITGASISTIFNILYGATWRRVKTQYKIKNYVRKKYKVSVKKQK